MIPDTLPDSCPGSVVVIFLTETIRHGLTHHSDLLLRTMLTVDSSDFGDKPKQAATHTLTHSHMADQATETES